MSKPMLVTLPFVFLLLDFWPLQRVQSSRLKGQGSSRITGLILEKVPFLILAAVSSIVTFLVQREGRALLSFTKFTWDVRFGNAVVSYSRYLGKIFWPSNLAIPYVDLQGW